MSGLTTTLLITFINTFTRLSFTQLWFMPVSVRTIIGSNTCQFRETTMIGPKKIGQIARQVHESMPEGTREFGEDVEKKIRQTL